MSSRAVRFPGPPANEAPPMISKLLQGTLLAAAAIATSAVVVADQEGPTSKPAVQKDGDGPAVKGDKKKEAKDDKITVWTLHAEGAG